LSLQKTQPPTTAISLGEFELKLALVDEGRAGARIAVGASAQPVFGHDQTPSDESSQ
jgi:hypothetical protein